MEEHQVAKPYCNMIPFGGEIYVYIYRRKCWGKTKPSTILNSEWKENTSAFPSFQLFVFSDYFK